MTIVVRDRVLIDLDNIECQVEFVTFDGMKEEPEHFAVLFNRVPSRGSTLVRIHSECITGDLFSSRRCDCGDQLKYSIDLLEKSGGVLLYLRQEGRGIGLYEKLAAYRIQDGGKDTFEANEMLGHAADGRKYDFVPGMLNALGVQSILLITNNPEKEACFHGTDVDVTKVIKTPGFAKKQNMAYLRAKKAHGHNISI